MKFARPAHPQLLDGRSQHRLPGCGGRTAECRIDLRDIGHIVGRKIVESGPSGSQVCGVDPDRLSGFGHEFSFGSGKGHPADNPGYNVLSW
jgi:hypothetical protein